MKNARSGESMAVRIRDLPKVPNICNQILREFWKSKKASIAHVEMKPGNVSLLHKHKSFTELYYILSGQGILEIDGKTIYVEKDTLVEIKPGKPHKLTNPINPSSFFCVTESSNTLRHLVISIPAFNPDDVIIINEK